MSDAHISYRPLAIMLPQLFRQTIKVPQTLADQGLALSHVNVMLMLEAYPQSTLSEIGRRMSIFRSNITPLINALVRNGYVERQPHVSDRRSVCIALTEKGMRVVGDIHDEINQRLVDMTHSLTSQERIQFQRICAELGDLLTHMMD